MLHHLTPRRLRSTAILAVTVLLLVAPSRFARAGDLDEDFQVWAPTIIQLDILPKTLRGWLELQPRFTRDAGQLDVVIWRPALGFYPTPWISLWGGYAFVERLKPAYSAEHRVWEQVQAAGTVVPELGVEAGYLFEIVHRRAAEDLGNHALFLALWVDLP